MVTVQARAPRVYQLVKPGPEAGALFVSQERGKLVLEIANFKRSLPRYSGWDQGTCPGPCKIFFSCLAGARPALRHYWRRGTRHLPPSRD